MTTEKIKNALEKASPGLTILSFFIVAGTALMGFAIGEIQNKYPNISILTIFFICTLFSGLLLLSFSHAYRGKVLINQEKIMMSISSLENKVSHFTHPTIGFDSESMMSQLEFMKFEQSFTGNEVWVVSSSLENDDPGTGSYHSIVADNLDRGIIYRYFYPQTSTVLGRVSRIKAAHIAHESKILWHPLSIEVFRLHVGKNMGVYRNTKTGESDLSFIEIKFDKTVRWAKLDEQLTLDVVGWLAGHTVATENVAILLPNN